ncbi:rCG34491 [Rattus norvegicus]|uniref:RCG34491 n=1 Tax=Rattus norvegicus TaxID=10116 RepID=A6HEN7_RAT|nr:rCG34491 [Rattus norvegicus]
MRCGIISVSECLAKATQRKTNYFSSPFKAAVHQSHLLCICTQESERDEWMISSMSYSHSGQDPHSWNGAAHIQGRQQLFWGLTTHDHTRLQKRNPNLSADWLRLACS